MSLYSANHRAFQPYANEVIAQMPRVLGALDREPWSLTYGSFDREHWGWKFRDFPITMLQGAVYPLALLWSHPFSENQYYRNPRLLSWITATLENTCSRQRRNGAFDGWAPHAKDHGVTLAMAYFLAETLRTLGNNLQAPLQQRMLETIAGACEFAIHSNEGYAFISNHQALFALAYLNAGACLNEVRYQRQGEHVIETIIARQSADGWYQEYEGADPGYESLGIFYLAMYWQRTGSLRLLESLQRSVEFYSHCIHPDGSVGGVYGSRQTVQYYPAGFEKLGARLPMAAAVALFMRKHFERRNVLTPAAADPENLIPLAYVYLEAALDETPTDQSLPPLPCESLIGKKYFPVAGLVMVGAPQYYAVINTAKGGVCRIYDKNRRSVAYEDAGYVASIQKRRFTSQIIGFTTEVKTKDDNAVSCSTVLAEARQELLSPSRFVLLRLLNLTLFRSLKIGNWIQGQIVKRLILTKRPGPLRLVRTVQFSSDEIRFLDELERTSSVSVDKVDLTRSFTGIHMGSAKYFFPSELGEIRQAATEEMADNLNAKGRARLEFVVRFPITTTPEAVVAGTAGEHRNRVPN